MNQMNQLRDLAISDDYRQVLEDLKKRVQQAQYQALQAVNRELVGLYWDIGRTIVENQERYKWGEGVVERLARDLQVEFEGVAGFSRRNLLYMRRFYLTYKDNPKVQPMVAQIGWTHNIIILDKCKDELEREFYLRVANKMAWSKYTLTREINSNAYERYMARQTSFDHTLSEEQQAKSILAVKDDYNFDFLGIEGEPSERELEDALVSNITKFLSEMGDGRGYFTFVGRQFRVEVDTDGGEGEEDEAYIDLLFYHRELRCLVAVELKSGKFIPEYAGKMQFYLSVLDEKVRLPGENPSIGIIVCRSKDRTRVKYTLRDVTRPIGVATYNQYENLEDLPGKMSKYLPSPEEIESRLSSITEG